MKTTQFFSAILILAFLGSLTNVFALNEKRNSLDETELSVSTTSVAQSDSVKATLMHFPTCTLWSCIFP